MVNQQLRLLQENNKKIGLFYVNFLNNNNKNNNNNNNNYYYYLIELIWSENYLSQNFLYGMNFLLTQIKSNRVQNRDLY